MGVERPRRLVRLSTLEKLPLPIIRRNLGGRRWPILREKIIV